MRRISGSGQQGWIELAALAVDEHGIRALGRNRLHHQHVGLGEVADGGDEGALVPALLVPQPFERAELGADVHLVHGGVEPHPRIAPGEGPGIVGERLRHLRVLEVLQPVGQAEVAQVHDRHDAEPLHLGGDLVEEGPVVSGRGRDG